MYVIVGSRAALHHKIIPPREPKDWDIFTEDDRGALDFIKENLPPKTEVTRIEDTNKGCIYFTTNGIVESEHVLKCSNISNIFDRMLESSIDNYASAEWLYFLKMSHRYKKDSPHFWKTRIDVEHMRAKGVTMPLGSGELFKERERLTYTNKLPNLNQGSNTFFKKEDGFYVYDHDSIHEAVKILEKPAYRYYMKEGAEVLTSKEKFFEVPWEVRMFGVYEESCVLALERSLIPFEFKPDPEQAFRMALSKVCTSITGGWFREFAWENCLKIMNMYKKMGTTQYVEKFKEGLNNGVVLPFNKELT